MDWDGDGLREREHGDGLRDRERGRSPVRSDVGVAPAPVGAQGGTGIHVAQPAAPVDGVQPALDCPVALAPDDIDTESETLDDTDIERDVWADLEMERQAQARDEEDFPVVGNVRHPLICGHQRVILRHEAKKEIASLVTDESYWMSLYCMYADHFDPRIHRRQVGEFVHLVQSEYDVMLRTTRCPSKSLSAHAVDQMWSLWNILAWIHAARDWDEPPRPPTDCEDCPPLHLPR